MPASRSERLRPAVLALALAAGGACRTSEPEVRPFRLEAVDAAGLSVVEGLASPATALVSGDAVRAGPSAIVVTPQGGGAPVTIRLDGAASQVTIPDVVASGAVRVEIRHDAAARGPGGAPLPIRGLRIADASGRWRFFAGEGDLRDGQGFPLVPRPLGPEVPGEDVPSMRVVIPGTVFEPAECGDVYWDRLQVVGSSEVVLDRGEEGRLVVPGGEDLPPWTVRHVASWHRGGGDDGGSCAGRLRSWFQAAGWR